MLWDRVEDGRREERSRHAEGDASFVGGCLGNTGVELHFDMAMRCSVYTRLCSHHGYESDAARLDSRMGEGMQV